MLVKKTESETYCGWKGGWAAVVGVPIVNGENKFGFSHCLHNKDVLDNSRLYMKGSWEAKLRTKGTENSEQYTVTALTAKKKKKKNIWLASQIGHKGNLSKKKKKLKIIVQKH